MPESFAELFEDSQQKNVKPGTLIQATVVSLDQEKAIVNAGLKSECFIPIEQFKNQNGEIEIAEGDEVEVVLESIDDGLGHTILSRENAKRMKKWQALEQAMSDKSPISGRVIGKVKGGLAVEVGVVRAFLPGSLVDVRPVKDFTYLEGQEIEAMVIKMDKLRNNVVISRKAALEEVHSEDREALLDTLEAGKEIQGVVKNLADYGAFVDLGGIDGLLHVTDISWDRVNHPSEALKIGDQLTVKILSFDREKGRISLGLKQLGDSPWENISERLPIGKRITGTVSSLAEYGAFVKIEDGVEGLVHSSELDWTNSNTHPSKVVQLGQEVEVVVLDVSESKERISLSIKKAQENPWEAFAAAHKKGDKITAEIRSITDFGLFVGLPGGIDGLVHIADISWKKLSHEEVVKNYQRGQEIEVAILNIDAEKERISLGIKQLEEDAFSRFGIEHKKGSIVKGTVLKVDAKGANIEIAEGLEAHLKASEIADEKVEDATKFLNAGETIEALVSKIDKKSRTIELSIKAKKLAEEKEAVSDYNKKAEEDTTSKLGDILKEAKDDEKNAAD